MTRCMLTPDKWLCYLGKAIRSDGGKACPHPKFLFCASLPPEWLATGYREIAIRDSPFE